jgi:RND family efflux transporter MFP subunit
MVKVSDGLRKVVLQLFGVIAVIAVGIGIAALLISLKKPPERKELEVVAPLLSAQEVHRDTMQMTVKGFGTAGPAVEVQIVPQVAGVVVDSHRGFVNGGFFKADEPLIVIDQRDYKLAVESAASAVAAAQVQVDKETAEADVAKKEWALLHPEKEPESALVFREPQIRQAKAQLRAAMAQLETAKLSLERTVISMPFDGRVVSESVDIGQYLAPGQPIATVYATDVIEIVVPLEDSELEWFDIPINHVGFSVGVSGPEVEVKVMFAGVEHKWQGRIVRTEGRIDSSSRMVRVVAQVDRPFDTSNGNAPLVPGMFVEVLIKGKELKDVFRIRRYAVHNVDEVWVVNDNRLHIQKVKIARRDKEYAYVTSGIEDGDIIIMSPLDTVTDGMQVRVDLGLSEEKVE